MLNRLLAPISILLSLGMALPALAQFETRAKAAYVIDVTTGTVLLAKNAEEPLPPASMSKPVNIPPSRTQLFINTNRGSGAPRG